MELAREQAPSLSHWQARVVEAESAVDAASVVRFNPELSAAAGPRDAAGGSVVDWSVGFEQRFELGGQRGLRQEAARAGVNVAAERLANARRLLAREVAHSFASALYWERRVQLAAKNAELAAGVARIAAERHAAGDVGGLDEAVAELAVYRAEAALERSRASLLRAEGRLKQLLGLEVSREITCRGELLALAGRPLPRPEERADVRALRAALGRADAEISLARAKRVPELALGAAVKREESVEIVQGAITVALPIFDRGQGDVAVARARRLRLQTELDAATRGVEAETASARAVEERLRAAAQRFEERGPDALERAERLASGSYEAGAIPLGELLAIRRELAEVRRDHVELRLDAARAWIDAAASAGELR